MYKISTLTKSSPVDLAALELKKYLRMMMPECGDVSVAYGKDASDGFRLGLMQELSLDVSDAEDAELDDILYIDCDESGGIIAGDNPRSVLLAVYEYLRQQGCRWLMPGPDGEYIPEIAGLKPIKYRHKPSCRYRGWCNEGSESQQCMFDAIDFTPKVGMNVFMQEFQIPTSYYKRYYNHMRNEEARPPEPVSDRQILQWKRQCEAEISRRGLQYHDIGHGWSADPFGIDSSLRAWDGDNEDKIPAESRKFLALVNGERKLWGKVPNYTQYCMSNPEARALVTSFLADYAERNTNVDYLHLWLGDGKNNHCECAECQKKTPSDWYVIQLNEVARELKKRKIATRVVFISYLDTVWAPVTERLECPERFTLLFAPISRSYTESMSERDPSFRLKPFLLNKNELPKNLDESFRYLDEWKRDWKGANVAYEYHFWRHMYYDVGMIRLSQIINEDVRVYKSQDVNGIIEDGSQRAFFPSGLAFYTYARSLFNMNDSAEKIAEDYFKAAYGEDWRDFYDYLSELSEVFDSRYLEGELSANPAVSKYYKPEYAKGLTRVAKILEKGRALIASHYNSDERVRTVSVRLLEHHADWCEALAAVLSKKAVGDDAGAKELYSAMRLDFGRREAAIESFYDHGLAFICLDSLINSVSKTDVVTELGN